MRPCVVVSYDKYMGRVDRSDQMVSYATFNSRTLKWWKRFIFHVMSLSVLSAYLLYKAQTNDATPMLHSVLHKQLVTNLVQSVDHANVPGMSMRSPGRPSNEPLLRLQGGQGTSSCREEKKNITRSCVVCVPVERELLASVGQKENNLDMNHHISVRNVKQLYV